ncbi:hypothetical protein LPB67_05735 [Undibacterium sp. Jales W-56]|uniref:hypothetical protein n=1 Tax=Undibacterium sp. Jales W-56 TaxID=2897325 RepID=UPI0021D2232D|nr:hypothetical protein [Undibacterium sp. Jales W-56]MCU6433278.1 hypothetical protein [Undibacterium sp. Jales W-56]
MKRLPLILLLATLCLNPALAANNPCAGASASQPCQPASDQNPTPNSTPAFMVSIQDPVAAASLAAEAAANAAKEPRQSSVRDNIYFNAIFWILALLAPLGACIMIVLNLLEYRINREDQVKD